MESTNIPIIISKDDQKTNKEVTPLVSFLTSMVSGGVSGIISKSITAPIERVKLILQTQFIISSVIAEKRYKGPLDCVKRVYNEQGIISFWRGNVANVLRYFPNQALNFAFRDKFKLLFIGDNNYDSNINNKSNSKQFWIMFFGNLSAAGAAGGCALTVGYPLDMARTRLATDLSIKSQKRQFSGTFDCIKHIYKYDGGIRGVYSGFGAALWGVIIFKALFMGGYDISKSILKLDQNSSIRDRFLLAQFITTGTGTICYPLDTIRRRMMMQAKLQDGSGPLYNNGFHCLKCILKDEGTKGLFRGLSVNLLRGIGGSLLLVGYDEIKKYMHDNLL